MAMCVQLLYKSAVQVITNDLSTPINVAQYLHVPLSQQLK